MTKPKNLPGIYPMLASIKRYQEQLEKLLGPAMKAAEVFTLPKGMYDWSLKTLSEDSMVAQLQRVQKLANVPGYLTDGAALESPIVRMMRQQAELAEKFSGLSGLAAAWKNASSFVAYPLLKNILLEADLGQAARVRLMWDKQLPKLYTKFAGPSFSGIFMPVMVKKQALLGAARIAKEALSQLNQDELPELQDVSIDDLGLGLEGLELSNLAEEGNKHTSDLLQAFRLISLDRWLAIISFLVALYFNHQTNQQLDAIEALLNALQQSHIVMEKNQARKLDLNGWRQVKSDSVPVKLKSKSSSKAFYWLLGGQWVRIIETRQHFALVEFWKDPTTKARGWIKKKHLSSPKGMVFGGRTGR